jgi:hypothetical protein
MHGRNYALGRELLGDELVQVLEGGDLNLWEELGLFALKHNAKLPALHGALFRSRHVENTQTRRWREDEICSADRKRTRLTGEKKGRNVSKIAHNVGGSTMLYFDTTWEAKKFKIQYFSNCTHLNRI